MKARFFIIIVAILSAHWNTVYALRNLTGTYKCSGVDTKDGAFTGIDAMELDIKNSTDKVAGYSFTAPGFQGGLNGFAVFDGQRLAIYFDSVDKSSNDAKNNYGVILASVSKNAFKKVYYEPQYKGGSTGTVECIKVSSKIERKNS